LFHFIFFITTHAISAVRYNYQTWASLNTGHFSLAMSKARFSSLPQLIRAAVPCACA